MNDERVLSLSILCCEATGGPLSNLFAKDSDTLAHRDQCRLAHDSVGDCDTFAHRDQRWQAHDSVGSNCIVEGIDSSFLREGEPGKSSWPSFLQVPIGDFPTHWGDGMHDGDGHGLRSGARDLEGEVLLKGGLAGTRRV